MRSLSLTVTLFVIALAHVATAQGPVPSQWRVPIHADTEVAGSDTLWAAGPDYKVAFGRGFTFYPVLGTAYPENLPLAWSATTVTVDGEPWLAPTDFELRREDWRIEYRSAGLIERYDVLAEGVEQSFVLTSPPPRRGDLVLTGAIETPLTATARGTAHQPILFRGPDDEPILRYGEAWAIDANGVRIAVPTSHEAGRIRMHVDAKFLQRAAYPVTLDPLTSTATVVSGTSAALDSDIVSANALAFSSGSHLVVFSRASAMSDIDAFGYLLSRGLSNPQTVWSQTSTVTSASRPRCTYMEPYWVIVWEGTSVLPTPSVRAYVQDRRRSSLNSGTTTVLTPPAGSVFGRPDVGTDQSSIGLQCLVVFEDYGAGNTEVRGARFFPLSNSFGTPFLLAPTPVGSTRERSSPSVASSIDLNHWIVAYEEQLTSGSDDYDVYVNMVSRQGAIDTPRVVGPANNASEHARFPYVDGGRGRYVVTWSGNDTSILQRRVGYQRFDWDETSGTFSAGTRRTLATALLLGASVAQYGVAFDQETLSHWAIVYRSNDEMRVARVGFTGGVVESATLGQDQNGVSAGAVSYQYADSLTRGRFACAWGEAGIRGSAVLARFLTYPSGAFISSFGDPACGLSLSAFDYRPYAGNGLFRLTITGAPNGAPTVLFASPNTSAPLPIPLAAPCTLSLPLNALFVVESKLVNSSGLAEYQVPLPDDPLFQGSVYFQGAALEPGFNPLGLSVTGGVGVHVQ